MVNSVKDRLNETDTISEIKLLLGYNKDTVCVVVEGEDDQVLFRPLLAENVVILQSYASKNGVNDIVKKYFPRNKRVIGIRDKDYSKKSVSTRVFFCDYCCAEMMIVSIDACFERLYCGYYKKDAMNINDLKLHCLERLEKLSKYRMLNEQFGWHVKFNGIRPSKFYQKDIEKMDEDILDELNRQNPDNTINQSREKQCCNLSKCTSLSDYLNITNGHDFINLFYKICTGNFGKGGTDAVANTLRATFGKEEFQKTELYKRLNTYQKNKQITIVE